MKYTDLQNFTMTFDPLTQKDKRWKEVFKDKYARIIFSGFRLNHLLSDKEIDRLMDESLNIAEQIRNNQLKLEQESLKGKLRATYYRITHGNVSCEAIDNDMNDQFVEHLLPYLKEEKKFGYTIKLK